MPLEGPLELPLVRLGYTHRVDVGRVDPDAGVQHRTDHLHGRVVAHGVEVVRTPAEHVPADLRRVEHPQDEADVRRPSDLGEEGGALLGRELLRVVEVGGYIRAGGVPEGAPVGHRAEDRAAVLGGDVRWSRLGGVNRLLTPS